MCVFFRILLACAFLSSAPLALASSTLRCGSAVVSVGDRAAEVQDKCGEAQSRDFLGLRTLRIRHFYGFSQEEVPLEEWSYRMPGGMRYFLRFEGNRLVDIQSKRVP